MTQLIIQPGPATADDTFIDSMNPHVNFHTEEFLAIYRNGSDQLQSLIRFSLSQIPKGATITQARLYLYITTASGTQTLFCQRTSQTWYQTTVDWAIRPMPGEVSQIAAISSGAWVSFIVTPDVIAWLADPNLNLGWQLLAEPCDEDYADMCSGDYLADPTKRPYLKITYTYEGPSPDMPLGSLWGIPLSGIKYQRVFVEGAGAGDIDLYTVPAGKKAYVLNCGGYNAVAGTCATYMELKDTGTYYRIRGNANFATLTGSTFSQSIFLSAGQTLSVHTSQAGMNLWAKVIEFDATAYVASKEILSLVNGDNTVYTCPAGKMAILLGPSGVVVDIPPLFYVNVSGGSRIVYWNVVASGSAPGASNRVTALITVANTESSATNVPMCLSAGDYININTNSGDPTQIAWVNVVELDV
jgi:hypothetical protein